MNNDKVNKYSGLTENEVKERIKEGKVNKIKEPIHFSHLKIIFSSFFNFYNIILFIIALFFLYFQLSYEEGISYIPITKYGFLVIILFNASISIYSQEKSRRALKKVKVIKPNKVKVIRDNKELIIDGKEIVIDDLIINNFKEDNFILVDSKIIEGSGYFNESILTGESKLVYKKEGDTILSGSSLIYGDIISKVINVGNDTFIKKLENKVKSIKKKKSKLNKDINLIIAIMVLLAVPATICVFISSLISSSWEYNLSIINDVSTIIVGMIPIGLVLLSSVTLANSIAKLAKTNVSTEELYAIETLARIDILALDKTGTLTSNDMKVKEFVLLNNELDKNVILGEILTYLNNLSDNDSSIAIKSYCNSLNISSIEIGEIEEVSPFDSFKKYSFVKTNRSTYYFGALDVLINEEDDEEIINKCSIYSKKGYRIIAFKENNSFIGYFVLENKLRKNVNETLKYFNEIGVKIKVISGDNLDTVKEVARLSGIKNYDKCIDLNGYKIEDIKDIASKYDVFARSTPELKEEIIRVLMEEEDHEVAYIGDGINDITSLRRATSSIALASGVESSKLISDFTLLDNDFSHLVDVIKEGRRVIRNVERTCNFFVAKDILLFVLAFSSFINGNGLVIGIENIYIFEGIIVALCGFLLSIENSAPKVENTNMVKNVLLFGGMSGIYLSFAPFILSIISSFYELSELSSISGLAISLGGISILILTAYPFTKYSKIVTIIGASLTIFGLILFPDVFLDPTYLSSANTIKDQISLLFSDAFNLSFYSKINYETYSILLAIFIIGTFLYLFIGIKLKKKAKQNNSERRENH